MAATFITFILSNFTLTCFVLGLIFTAISLALKSKPLRENDVAEALFSWFLFFSFGVSFIYNFMGHVFYAEKVAAFIGWANSPFQYEVGFASLGFGIVGVMAFWRDAGFRAAALIGPAFFLWGAAGGHVYQMVAKGNFAPGNAGMVFWTDIFLPAIGFVLLHLRYRRG